MSRKYYVWKDPACGGKNIEWQVLSGAEFYTMMQLPENKSRRFIPFFDEDYEDVDTIYIEATVAQYKSWWKEYDKYRYSQTTSKPYSVLSINCPVPESENTPVEIIQDETMDTEASAIDLIQSEKVRTIMSALPPKDRWLVEEIYMRQYLMGYSVRKICTGLESDGIRTARGTSEWHDSTVQGILRNE